METEREHEVQQRCQTWLITSAGVGPEFCELLLYCDRPGRAGWHANTNRYLCNTIDVLTSKLLFLHILTITLIIFFKQKFLHIDTQPSSEEEQGFLHK